MKITTNKKTILRDSGRISLRNKRAKRYSETGILHRRIRRSWNQLKKIIVRASTGWAD